MAKALEELWDRALPAGGLNTALYDVLTYRELLRDELCYLEARLDGPHNIEAADIDRLASFVRWLQAAMSMVIGDEPTGGVH
ncbi:hypothetical protein H1235_08020 [Pseudoxanthomonas sp. NC8]|nr:hypothetical protein H1235_08020 [Pseudoxanthomonas sp. NC8]